MIMQLQRVSKLIPCLFALSSRRLAIVHSNHRRIRRSRHVCLLSLPSEPGGGDKAEMDNLPMSRKAFLASMVVATMPVATQAQTSTNATGATSTTNLSRNQSELSTLQESISGFVAGAAIVVAKTLVKYPLDTATVRLQMPNSTYSLTNLTSLFEGSYRGVTIPLIANIPAGAIFFAVKDACKEAIHTNTALHSSLPRWAETSLAVAVAQIPYWLVRNPTEVVKTRQQAGINGYGDGVSIIDAYRQILADSRINTTALDSPMLSLRDSIASFYLGYWENFLYAYPSDVIKFVCYEQLTGGRKLPPAEGAVAGAISTAIAQLITTPLDVIRNRAMAGTTSKIKDGTAPESRLDRSYFEVLTRLARDEGLTGLFAGAPPRVGKALLSGAIQFAMYEETKQEFAKFFQRQKR